MAESEFRVFKNQQGNEIKAKLTRVSGDDVYIERDDGQSIKTDIMIYSAADQVYIQD
ncbi:MAG: outer membrane lipoprotein SlyB [Lentimonas sp.]|jgi:outer membrane lipoprotein SlyB